MGETYKSCANECVKQITEPTIKEVLDGRIDQARRRVEELCIKKAKLETLNMLNMPWYQVRDLFE